MHLKAIPVYTGTEINPCHLLAAHSRLLCIKFSDKFRSRNCWRKYLLGVFEGDCHAYALLLLLGS